MVSGRMFVPRPPSYTGSERSRRNARPSGRAREVRAGRGNASRWSSAVIAQVPTPLEEFLDWLGASLVRAFRRLRRALRRRKQAPKRRRRKRGQAQRPKTKTLAAKPAAKRARQRRRPAAAPASTCLDLRSPRPRTLGWRASFCSIGARGTPIHRALNGLDTDRTECGPYLRCRLEEPAEDTEMVSILSGST